MKHFLEYSVSFNLVISRLMAARQDIIPHRKDSKRALQGFKFFKNLLLVGPADNLKKVTLFSSIAR